MGNQLWASQRRLFNDDSFENQSEDRYSDRKPVVRSVGQRGTGADNRRGAGDRAFGLPPSRPPPTPKCTLYIGNILFDVTAEDLKNVSSQFGTVVNTRVIYDSRGLSRGFGYVKFETVEMAANAVDHMHLMEHEGRQLTANFAQTELLTEHIKPRATPTRTLFVGNIAHQITDRDLHELFDDIPNVVDVRVAVDRRTGMPRGFAHAEFTDVESAIAGFDILQGKAPYGRPLRLDYSNAAEPQKKTSRATEILNSGPETEINVEPEAQQEAQQEIQQETQPEAQPEAQEQTQQETQGESSQETAPKAAQI
ncbi:C6 transcription factor [Arthroderma uncinatum]|uniref:C6 transcription factor n=1 Tax=Arthroderma uncinatum TaxID=74035 RepID=UPI00144ACB65|nr:C6 transcription factor [Arthroderma uncinatum]KAF3481981.1 C6 transcription factor [Arthroderma uncinatum]